MALNEVPPHRTGSPTTPQVGGCGMGGVVGGEGDRVVVARWLGEVGKWGGGCGCTAAETANQKEEDRNDGEATR